MGLLTESKIRDLLKTTNLKYSHELIIEQNTIITPAAKSYINEKRIHLIRADVTELSNEPVIYSDKEGLLETKTKPIDFNLRYMQSKIDKLIIKATVLQKESLKDEQLLSQLKAIINILKRVKETLGSNKAMNDLDEQIKQFYLEHTELITQFDTEGYPDFTESYIILRLFEFYVDVQSICYELMIELDNSSEQSQRVLQWLMDSCLIVYIMEKSRGGI